jgi:hypothetical protein
MLTNMLVDVVASLLEGARDLSWTRNEACLASVREVFEPVVPSRAFKIDRRKRSVAHDRLDPLLDRIIPYDAARGCSHGELAVDKRLTRNGCAITA